ncbi:leucyl aminopeptidase, partial [Francisella tularensis subsp. holarctica]|nr:leucyl aminopeptidase [Francisella tularensis subsp. holarctica]
NKSTLAAEIMIVAQENLLKLLQQTKSPNTKSLLDRRIFKAKSCEVLPLLHGDKIGILLGLCLRQDFIASEYDNIIA